MVWSLATWYCRATVPMDDRAATGSDGGVANTGFRRLPAFRGLLLLAVVSVILLAYFFRDALPLDRLVHHETTLRRYLHDHPLGVWTACFSAYVIATALSLPGAALMSLLMAWYLGFWRALVLVSLASTFGATLALLLSRYLLRDSFERRFGERLQGIQSALNRDGAFYLFTLRLVPVFPFFVINAVMGLTSMPARTFIWVSWLGMLPGTCVFVLAGSRFPDLATLLQRGPAGILTWQILLAFALLGFFPLLTRWLINVVRRRSNLQG